jgi:hypothetical protein
VRAVVSKRGDDGNPMAGTFPSPRKKAKAMIGSPKHKVKKKFL